MTLRLLRQSVLVAFSLLVVGSAPAWADDDAALAALGLTPEPSKQSVTSPRTPRPTSKIAENVTVITAEDITRINAHTLVDVLQTVPGIQFDFVRGPGGYSGYFNIQGAHAPQVLVLLDGIPFNDFQQNQAMLHNIPVQHIERIEIIKGAASAAWGPALGGVVNIITKSPDPEKQISGMVSGSYGEWNTTDARSELSGTINRFGYYLLLGNLHTDGMNPNTGVNQNTFYGKLSYIMPSKGLLTLGYGQFDAKRGFDSAAPYATYYDSEKNIQNYGFLKYSQPLGERLNLDVTGYITRKDVNTYLGDLIGGAVVPYLTLLQREESRGLTSRLTWGDNRNNLVTGFDIEHAEAEIQEIVTPFTQLPHTEWTKWAAHANGTMTFGALTILPGIRYDHTGLSGSYLSYTLGATYQLTDSTVLRAYGARGYCLPNPQFQHDNLSTTRTVQAGVETTAIPYLWLKGTFFYNRLDDVEYTQDPNLYNQTKQGFELEGRTTPLYGLSLVGGYTYLYATDRDTGKRLESSGNQSVPPQSLKLGLNYDQKDLGLRGALTGNYVNWNAEAGRGARDSAILWDLHLNWQLHPHNENSPELFFSIRNLFNGEQSNRDPIYPNAPRWIEGGVRFRF